MFCTECGNKLPDGVKFCPECGAKLKGNEAAPEPVNVAEPVMEATPVVAEPVAEAEPIQASEPVKVAEPVAPAQIPVTPVRRPAAPTVQQKPSKVVKKKTGIDGSYFKSANYWMIFLGNILSLIGCLLPFESVRDYSLFELSAGGGGAVIIAIIVCVVFTFVKPMVVFIPSIVSVSLYGLLFMAIIADGLWDALHVGAYLVLVASIAALVGAVRFRKE